MLRWLLRLSFSAAALFTTTLAAAADPVTIRIAWITIGNPPLLEPKKELGRHWGESYRVEPIHFQGTPPIMAALAAGELEIANLSFPSLGNAIVNAGMSDLRVIGDEGQDGVTHSIEYMVLKDGPVKTVDDLKGKVLATNIIGSAVDIGVKLMLKRHDLIDKRDYSVIEAAFPNMTALLLQHKADLVVAVPPFSLDEHFRDAAQTLFTQKDAMGKSQLAVWTARAPFIAQHRAALVDFSEDYLRIFRWYLDPANRPQMLQTVSSIFKVPVATLEKSTFKCERRLFRPQRHAGYGGAPGRCRCRGRARLFEAEDRSQALHRSHLDGRGGEARRPPRLIIPGSPTRSAIDAARR
jgi:sulfonate transport system substrate-binding protein